MCEKKAVGEGEGKTVNAYRSLVTVLFETSISLRASAHSSVRLSFKLPMMAGRQRMLTETFSDLSCMTGLQAGSGEPRGSCHRRASLGEEDREGKTRVSRASTESRAWECVCVSVVLCGAALSFLCVDVSVCVCT